MARKRGGTKTVAVAGLVALGVWLGTKIGDFLPDTGEGAAPGGTVVSVEPPEEPLGDPPPQADEPPFPDEDAPSGPPELVVIRIADGSYLVRTGGGAFESMTLEDAVAAAAAATGTEEGHRVRVERTPTARAIDQTNLNNALAEAGVGEAEIQRIGDFVTQ